MNKRIVVGLDPTPHARKAVEVAIARARNHIGVVVGVAFIDLPGIESVNTYTAPAAGFVARKARDHLRGEAEKRAQKLLDEFAAQCRAADVGYETVIAEGTPADGLFTQALSADLVVLGTRTFFTFDAQQVSDSTLAQLVARRVCPVLAVPPDLNLPVPNVLFPYDGSVAAARALRLFAYLTPPLALNPNLVLLCVIDDEEEGRDLLDGPERFLAGHGHRVKTEILPGTPRKVVVQRARELQPGLVVVGAQGKGKLRARVFGSVTKTLIDDGTLPLFLTD